MTSRSQLTLLGAGLGAGLIGALCLSVAAFAEPAASSAEAPAASTSESAAEPKATEPSPSTESSPPVGCPYRPGKLELIV